MPRLPERNVCRPEKPKLKWILIWTCIYLVVAFIILLLTSLIPSINTGSDIFRMIFRRGDTYDTTYFALNNFVYYCMMNIIGYVYVNVSNMNFSRKSLMHNNHERRRDFVLTIIFAPIFYFLGNNINLRAENDLAEIGESHSYWNCFLWNYCFWTPAYIIGLQFTHFDVELFRGFSLSP